ncbi:MAG TPA: carbohydrate-binding family 9-like protein [Pyrinomonadaceae bacterium]|nr:carbohydrate-binding family 9-like protein [Pyrinomonadaceae bacterium]
MQKSETIEAPRVEADISPDQFQNPAWRKAQPVFLTHLWSGEEAPVGSHAEARIIWSDESLSVQFVCNQDQPLIVNANPQLDQKTIGLWDRDVCEIFIAPFPNQRHRYFEFEAAPTGEWVDLAVHFDETKRENNFEFVSGIKVAASVSDDQVFIGMRIPWSDSIPKPQDGDEWRANLFRCVGLGNERYLAWQPTFSAEPNFHVPDAFGRLRFTWS